MKMAICLVLLASINSTVGNLLLKLSRKGLTENSSFYDQYFSISFAGAIVFYCANLFLFAKALDSLPVNIGYPILAATGFALLAISSWIFFDERLSLVQISGLCFIVMGLGLLTKDF